MPAPTITTLRVFMVLGRVCVSLVSVYLNKEDHCAPRNTMDISVPFVRTKACVACVACVSAALRHFVVGESTGDCPDKSGYGRLAIPRCGIECGKVVVNTYAVWFT